MWNGENVLFHAPESDDSDDGYSSDDDLTQEIDDGSVYYSNVFVDENYEWDIPPMCPFDEEDYAYQLWSRLMLRSVNSIFPRPFMRQSIPYYVVHWQIEITPMPVTIFGGELLCLEQPFWEIVPYTLTGTTEQLTQWYRNADFDAPVLPPQYAMQRGVTYRGGE